jgi:ABC-type phosphate transport system substrate-binding protein
MKTIQALIFTALCIFVASSSIYAQSVKVIANSSVQANAISAQDLKAFYLQTKNTFPDGTHIILVDSKDSTVHTAFLKLYIGMTSDAYASYVRGLVFNGKGAMPESVANDASVVAYVSKTKGAIGYVSAGANTSGLKVLQVNF